MARWRQRATSTRTFEIANRCVRKLRLRFDRARRRSRLHRDTHHTHAQDIQNACSLYSSVFAESRIYRIVYINGQHTLLESSRRKRCKPVYAGAGGFHNDWHHRHRSLRSLAKLGQLVANFKSLACETWSLATMPLADSSNGKRVPLITIAQWKTKVNLKARTPRRMTRASVVGLRGLKTLRCSFRR